MLLAERLVAGGGAIQIICAGFYAAWLTGLFMNPENSVKFRPLIWMLFSLVFFTQLFLGLAGIEKMLMTGKLHLPLPALIIAGPLYRGADFFMLILFCVTVVIVGPAWCSYLCYIGAWDDRMSRMASALKPLPAWVGKVRAGIFALTMILPLMMRFAGFSPLNALFVAMGFGLLSVAVMIIFSAGYGTMVHCSSFCPMGLFGNFLGRLSLFRIRIASNCCECMHCTKYCRYNALSEDNIRNRAVGSSCTLCGDCLAGCRSESIGYQLALVNSATARKIFVTLIISMHSIFMAVARI